MTPRSLSGIVLAAFLIGACSGTVPASSVAPTSVPTPAVSSATATPSVKPVAPRYSGENAAWVIQSRGGKPLIQSIDSAGENPFALAPALSGAYQNNPDWSPDGEWLTFTNAEGEHDDLYVVRADGSDLRKVYDCESPCVYLDDPAWSPDGRSIATCKASDDPQHPTALVSVDVQTGADTELYEPGLNQFCAGPRWSPDGTQIVLEIVTTSDDTVNGEITGVVLSVIDLTARYPSTRGLTKPESFAATADWSRATNSIVYNARVDATSEANDLYLLSPDGGDPTRLTFLADDGGSAYEPSWDNDGATVVFVNENGALMRVDVASGEVTPAFAKTIFANHPRVRPRP